MKTRFLLISLLIGITLSAQKFDKVKMDSLFALIDANERGMGSISIFENGMETYQKSIGYASIEDKLKATDETKYRIGSISKTFTATIIMKLVEEGKLSLETRLSEFYPEIKNAGRITIEHLLRHRSGIFNFTNTQDYQTWMEKPISKEDLVKKIVGYENVFEPNENAEYSNSNYVLLSYIAEKIEQKEFRELLNKNICEPCNLKDTYYGSKIIVVNKEAKSYNKVGNWVLAPETDMSIPVGAGAIVSTPIDLNKFLNCLFTNKILSQETVSIMREIKDNFGLGMFQVPFYQKKAFGHTGGIDGFQSNAFYFPEEKVSVAYLSNGVVMPVNDVLIGVLSIYYNRFYDLPTFKVGLQLNPEDLDAYLGVYSSPEFPLKITISKKENVLIAQATGQPSFPLEAYETHKFKFDQAKIKLEFFSLENKMILRQGGGEFELKKE